MQPLELFNNVQKARLLHNLLPQDMPDFISYLYEHTENLLADEGQALRDNWQDQLFSADFWLSLAGEVQKYLNRYQKDVQRSAAVFSDQLFGGHNAIYTVQVLLRYTARAETPTKFKQAAALLFS